MSMYRNKPPVKIDSAFSPFKAREIAKQMRNVHLSDLEKKAEKVWHSEIEPKIQKAAERGEIQKIEYFNGSDTELAHEIAQYGRLRGWSCSLKTTTGRTVMLYIRWGIFNLYWKRVVAAIIILLTLTYSMYEIISLLKKI